jgi:hypothetical protein
MSDVVGKKSKKELRSAVKEFDTGIEVPRRGESLDINERCVRIMIR